MENKQVNCKIEHHAILFALMAKYAITLCGTAGEDAILKGMTTYGNERGKRMAQHALDNGDPLTVMTNQAYGEWRPDYEGQMETGILRTEPTLQTYISKCAWCDAWNKHGLIDYGKYYCKNVDNAVYQGFHPDFVCTSKAVMLSHGGSRCEFDWGQPLSPEDTDALAHKKEVLQTSCTKDFNYHTAHILHTVGNTLKTLLGDAGEQAVSNAIADYIDIFGEDYYLVLNGLYT